MEDLWVIRKDFTVFRWICQLLQHLVDGFRRRKRQVGHTLWADCSKRHWRASEALSGAMPLFTSCCFIREGSVVTEARFVFWASLVTMTTSSSPAFKLPSGCLLVRCAVPASRSGRKHSSPGAISTKQASMFSPHSVFFPGRFRQSYWHSNVAPAQRQFHRSSQVMPHFIPKLRKDHFPSGTVRALTDLIYFFLSCRSAAGETAAHSASPEAAL